MADIIYTDIHRLQSELAAIEPKLKTALVRDAKKAAIPVESAIHSALPTISPLRGAITKGRLGFGIGVPSNKTIISFRASGSRFSAVTSLVSVKVQSPLTAIMDYAGRKGNGAAPGGQSKPYAYGGVVRTHTINGQGQAMIAKLNRMRRASRFAWPAAEESLPKAEQAVRLVVENACRRISRSFD
jgi:hypothetical protein